MANIILRKYGVATTIDFELYKLDGTGLKIDATSATGDITLYRDEANVETLDADAFVDEGAVYSLALSQAEMTAGRIIICIVDQSSPQVWLDKVLIVETYGNASAQHPFDLGTATQNVNVASIDNIDFGATMKASINVEVDGALNTAIPGTPTADSVNERVKAIDDKLPAAFATEAKQDAIIGYIDAEIGLIKTETDKIPTLLTESQSHPTLAEIEATTVLAKVTTVTTAHSTTNGKIDTVDTVVDAVKLKTDLIPADIATQLDTNIPAIKAKTDVIGASVALESGGNVAAVKAKTDLIPADIATQLDTNIPAIKAKTDLLTLTAIADAIWDEVNSGHVTAGTVGLALQNLLKIGKNKWSYASTTFTIYDDNGTSVLYQFTLDSATAPTSRTPV